MRVLVGCEFSGAVRRQFRLRGHDAWSCDLLEAEDGGPHIRRDVRDVLDDGWDLALFFPPCTYLTTAGNAWFAKDPLRASLRDKALDLVRLLMGCGIPKVAIENPVGYISTAIRKPDQIINPWQFGHPVKKRTCLWLKGLPVLKPTRVMSCRKEFCGKIPERKDRWKIRSRTFQGIARAMASQWG